MLNARDNSRNPQDRNFYNEVKEQLYTAVPLLHKFSLDSEKMEDERHLILAYILDVRGMYHTQVFKIMLNVYNDLQTYEEFTSGRIYPVGVSMFERLDEHKKLISAGTQITPDKVHTNEAVDKISDTRMAYIRLTLSVDTINVKISQLNKRSFFVKYFSALPPHEQYKEVQKNALKSELLSEMFSLAKDDMVRYKIVEATGDEKMADILFQKTAYPAVKVRVVKLLASDSKKMDKRAQEILAKILA